MINEFKEKMGDPEDTLIIIGDYGGGGLKGSRTSACKKFRKIFKDNGYEVYLLDEYKTSQVCSHCQGKVENFIERKIRKER